MTERAQGSGNVHDSKTIAQRIADAVAMFTVSAICLVLLLFVAHGTIVRTYEQLIVDKLLAQGGLVQSTLETFVRPGLPLRQFTGFQKLSEPMVKQDDMLDSMTAYDREGEVIFAAGDTRALALPPTNEQTLQSGVATMRSDSRYLQVVLPLRNKFERVGDLVMTVYRHRATEKVASLFRPVIIAAVTAAVGFGLVVFLVNGSAPHLRRRRVAAGFAASYMLVAAAIALMMINLFSEGAQSKGRVLADSLGQRLHDIMNFGLVLEQIDGLQEVLTEYRQLNPDIASAGVTVNGRIVVHSDPKQVGRYWQTDAATHEYRLDLRPPEHPRASTVVLAVPKAIVYWQVLRSVKNFAALFVASSFFAFLFMQVAQAIQQAMQSAQSRPETWREHAALDLVKPVFFLAVFVDHLAYAFLPQFVNEVAGRQGLSASYVAMPFMAYYLFFALVLVPAGRYEQRVGSRPLIQCGLLLTAASLIMIALGASFEMLVVARAIAGVGQGMLFIAIQSFVLAKSTAEHRTQANTIIVFGFQAGMISGMAIGSLLVGQITPAGVFVLGAAIAGCIMLYVRLALPDSKPDVSHSTWFIGTGDIWREITAMARDAKFSRTILLIGIPAKAVMTGIILFAMPLFLHTRGFAQEDIGQMTMIYAACVIFSSTWTARIADASANTGAILSWGAILTAGGLVVIALCGWDALATHEHAQPIITALMIVGVAMIGIAHGFINAPVITHVTQTDVAQRCGSGQVGATYRFIERAGHTLGPILMGQVFYFVGVSYAAFSWAGLAILTLGLVFLLSERAGRPATQEYA